MKQHALQRLRLTGPFWSGLVRSLGSHMDEPLKPTKRRRVLAIVGLYLLAWLVTALFGPASVMHRFDADHASGFRAFSNDEVASTRVRDLDVKDQNLFS